MKIAIIGAGNVATHLGIALKKGKHKIAYVYSHSMPSAIRLGVKLNTSFGTEIELIPSTADLYIISISDHAIKDFLKTFPHKNKAIIHTSGSVSMNVFGKKFPNCGVLYPVQTFSKDRKIDLKEVPLLIEASNRKTSYVINKVAKSISAHIFEMNSDSRKTVHLAAVIANNFTNHLFVQAEKILEKKNISFNLLAPLIYETMLKALTLSPSEAQTGPAKRGDAEIIAGHMKMLRNEPRLKQVYKLLSESIEETSGVNL